jgi:CPA2 family monovalent cation:H+ antiporter-2
MMAAAIDPTAFKETLVVLGATAIVIPIAHRLKLSPVVGFILLGVALGPFGLGGFARAAPWIGYVTITSDAAIAPVAEWGVVLLLFMIGLELSFERLRMMRKLVFGLGPAQIVVCAGALTAAIMASGVALAPAIVIALALAQSSTAVLVQTLAEEKKLTAPIGRASFAVLLFQDIAVVPILFGVSVMGAAHGGSSTLAAFGAAIGQAALALVAIIVVGRLGLRPLFRSVARSGSPDVFLAACLLVILAASLAASGAGLSAAMGALIAGLLLAETEYRRQIELLIEPFKGLFLGVFLFSAGMSIDLRAVIAAPVLVFGGAVALVAIKTALVFALARAFALPARTAFGAALLLGPGGEFAFVILGAARALHIVPEGPARAALLIAALTMTAIPFLSRLHERLTRARRIEASVDPALLMPADGRHEPLVVIAGFGRVGRVVAEMLETHKVAYVALDSDVDVVAAAHRDGKPAYYGDAANPAMLKHIGVDSMRALVATMDSPAALETVVAAGRALRGDLLIVARARDARHAARLYKLGASDVAPETIEASLQLSETVLVDLGAPMGPVIASIHDRRAAFRAEVQKLEPDADVPARPRRRLRDMARRRPTTLAPGPRSDPPR